MQESSALTDDSSLQALYVVNKYAKQLARDVNVPRPAWDIAPERDALRKNALYEVKHLVLQQIWDDATAVEHHTIRGIEFYCFYFGEWSFHLPLDECDAELELDGRLTLHDFNPSMAVTRSSLSLKDALCQLKQEYGIDANDHLERRHIPTTTGEFIDIGWPILSEY